MNEEEVTIQEMREVVYKIIKGIKWMTGFFVLAIFFMYGFEQEWIRYIIEISLIIFYLGIWVIDKKIQKKKKELEGT